MTTTHVNPIVSLVHKKSLSRSCGFLWPGLDTKLIVQKNKFLAWSSDNKMPALILLFWLKRNFLVIRHFFFCGALFFFSHLPIYCHHQSVWLSTGVDGHGRMKSGVHNKIDKKKQIKVREQSEVFLFLKSYWPPLNAFFGILCCRLDCQQLLVRAAKKKCIHGSHESQSEDGLAFRLQQIIAGDAAWTGYMSPSSSCPHSVHHRRCFSRALRTCQSNLMIFVCIFVLVVIRPVIHIFQLCFCHHCRSIARSLTCNSLWSGIP